MHIEFIVEDSSGAKLLEIILPKILGPMHQPHTWRMHAYKGVGRLPKGLSPITDANKRILLDQLPRILRGYSYCQEVDRVVVVVDLDKNNRSNFLSSLESVARQAGRPDTIFRFAVEEIEAWYLGDRTAISTAYTKVKREPIDKYIQDSICNTWEILADALSPGALSSIKAGKGPVIGDLKHEWAEKIGPHLSLSENRSPSFNELVDGLTEMIQEV